MTKLHFTAVPHAEDSVAALTKRYGDAGPENCDIVVALGGDGFMLQTLHSFTGKGKPIYGMNKGTVGFLMNEYHADDLIERLAAAEKAVIHPLQMTAHTASRAVQARAFNEVSLLRETRQAAKIRILVDGKPRISELICDGVWWRPPPDRPPITFPPMARSCRSVPTFWRSRRSRLFVPAAGAGRFCLTGRRCASRCWKAASARSARWPMISKYAT